MKEMKKLVLISLILAAIIGWVLLSCCRQEKKLTPDYNNKKELRSNCLSEKEAINEALAIYDVLFGEELRSAERPQILSVQKTNSLRSSSDTTDNEGIYVINFKEDKGYIVIAENRFNEPIITASPKGYLDISIVSDNMNLIPILSNTDAILEYNQQYQAITDLMTSDGKPVREIFMTDYYDYEFGPWEIVSQVGPLVPVEWDQRYPHNSKLKKINGEYPPVGCVATAMSQIMSYHRYPSYDWDTIIDDVKDDYSVEILSTLHRDLGKPENLDMDYSLTGSGASSSNVPRTFKAFGYQSSNLCDYQWETIKSEISNKRPVYIRANYFKHVTRTPRFLFWGGKTETSYSGGHAWVLDGIREVRRTVTQINRFTKKQEQLGYQTKELVHCNLGWDDDTNGYYLSKAFNTVKGAEMKSSQKADCRTYGVKGNFQYNHEIIKEIRKR